MATRNRSTDSQQPVDISSAAVTGRLPFTNIVQGSALSVVGVTGNATADHADIAAASDGHVLRRSGTSVGFGTVAVSALANGTTTVLTSSTTSNQNNWAPGLVGDTVIFWSGAGDITVTGFAGGVSGQKVKFVNTATNIATFSHQSGSSSAGNKFRNIATSAGTPVAAGGYIEYQYDGTDWRLISHEQGDFIDYGTSSTVVGWSVRTATNIRYKLQGRMLVLDFNVTGTSNAVGATFTVPFTSGNITTQYGIYPIQVTDNSGINATPGGARVLSGGVATVDFYTTLAGAGFTAANTKAVSGFIVYQVT